MLIKYEDLKSDPMEVLNQFPGFFNLKIEKKDINRKGIEQIFLLVKEGDIISEYKNCAHRICYIISVGDTYEEANERFEAASQTISIETKDIRK